jgi:hypothetical protein
MRFRMGSAYVYDLFVDDEPVELGEDIEEI